jgi:hypothetical protein
MPCERHVPLKVDAVHLPSEKVLPGRGVVFMAEAAVPVCNAIAAIVAGLAQLYPAHTSGIVHVAALEHVRQSSSPHDA